MPLVTIITVTYNAENVIAKTMESLKNQSFQDFHHLVVDGKSSDSTLEIINRFNLPQTFIISEPDKGLYDAMNKGLKNAKGKYIIFLNAGDAFHTSETLKEYIVAAKNNKDIIYGDTDIVDIKGDYLGPRHLSVPNLLTKESFSNGMLVCHQAFMVKREIAPEFNLNYRFSADYDWCIKCIEKSQPGNYENLNQVTIDYLSNGLTDKNKWKSLRERFNIMSCHYGFFTTILKHIGFISRAYKRGKI